MVSSKDHNIAKTHFGARIRRTGAARMTAVRARSKRPPVNDQEDEAGGQMSFLDHLDELRTRIIRSLVAIGAGMLLAFFFAERIGEFILGPAIRALPPGQSLIYTRPGEGFSFYLDTALIGGVVLAAPFVMYEVW